MSDLDIDNDPNETRVVLKKIIILVDYEAKVNNTIIKITLLKVLNFIKLLC